MKLVPESLMCVKDFKGMTYQDIASKVFPDIAKSAVSRYARGETPLRNRHKIKLLSAALDVPLMCMTTSPPESTDACEIAKEALDMYQRNYWNRGWELLTWLYVLHTRDTYIRSTRVDDQHFRYYVEKVRLQCEEKRVSYKDVRDEIKELKQRVRILETQLSWLE